MARATGRWWPPSLVLLAALAVLALSRGVVGVVIAIVMLVYAWVVSPAFFPRSADLQTALERARSGRAPLVFWKPGCVHCVGLRVSIGSTGRRVSWVDSSVDERAESMVRSQNGGDHTTPTVMFRDEVRTNPDAAWVRSLRR